MTTLDNNRGRHRSYISSPNEGDAGKAMALPKLRGASAGAQRPISADGKKGTISLLPERFIKKSQDHLWGV